MGTPTFCARGGSQAGYPRRRWFASKCIQTIRGGSSATRKLARNGLRGDRFLRVVFSPDLFSVDVLEEDFWTTSGAASGVSRCSTADESHVEPHAWITAGLP
jgi:hypothetical protein